MEILIKCSSFMNVLQLFFLSVFMCSSSLFFHGGIATMENKTDPIEVEALDAIFRKWKIDGQKAWNINSTNPCRDYVVNDETIDEFSSSRGKLEILCSCDNTTSICNIIRLSAWDLKLSGTIPNELENLTKLVYMNLDENSLTGDLPDFLWTLTEMETMELGRNQLSGNIPNYIWNLTNLETLDLYNNSFEGSIPLSIGNLINLKILNLEGNFFQGSIPSSIGNLVDLDILYLSNNNFEGEILNSLGNLTKLRILDLEGNSFQGSIPSSIGNLFYLEELDLSKNSFSSHLPQEIGNLKKLKELDLSENNFTGLIPNNLIQRQRRGLLNMSFEGNPDLCFGDLCGKSSSNKTTIHIIAVICSTIVVFSVAVIIFIGWKVKRSARNTRSEEPLRGCPLQGTFPGIHTSNNEFTYLDLVTMTKNFNKIIGKGGFGNVYYGIDQRNGSEVAAQILSRIHHKNFVSLVGYCTETGHLALVYEYMEGGSLRNLISGQCNSSTIISWRDRIRMSFEIAQGLNYLHQECQPAIVHRDVKTTNILLSQKFEVKIADFGLSKIFENGANTSMSTIVMGTFGYIDPEYHKTQKLNEKSDVYSFGIVLIELITGQPAVVNHEGERIPIATLVEPMIERGEIDEIIDPKLNGEYNIISARKALEIAFACIPQKSNERLSMFDIVKQLKECLEIEIPQKSLTIKSTDTDIYYEDVTAPFAR
ncbi:hypothetical protein ZOSMA_18G01380 [Zostera marina]|uniref:Protein kinase domain-containing protein n=1 Tax=Zostera marina TaxID=29655 RepID=A0A0K9PPN4_ZOSMR|nr:hypothetical protein ZOSMA_18G01380 [Zostera marina]